MSEQTQSFKEPVLQQIFQSVTNKIAIGAIHIPPNYSLANALQTAWFKIQSTKAGKYPNQKTAQEICTMDSIQVALYKMCVDGLNCDKHQCCFIIRGTELTYEKEYQGHIALAKRYSEVQSVNPAVIYKGDKFITKRESDGTEVLVSHEQPIENLDNEITGAYCVIVDKNGQEILTKMTRKMITSAWDFGKKKTFKSYEDGTMNDTQTAFEDQMCIKTVVKRACKPFINSSSDESIVPIYNNSLTLNSGDQREVIGIGTASNEALPPKTEDLPRNDAQNKEIKVEATEMKEPEAKTSNEPRQPEF